MTRPAVDPRSGAWCAGTGITLRPVLRARPRAHLGKEKPLRSVLKVAAAAMVGALALAACGSSSSPNTGGTAGSSATNIKVGMAYDIGGRGDKSFNDSAAAGLDKAAKEFGVQTKELAAVAGETDAQKAA